MERLKRPGAAGETLRYEDQCLLDSIASAVQAATGEDFEIPNEFRERRNREASFVERKGLKGKTLRQLDERWIRRMVDNLWTSDTPIRGALQKIEITYNHGSAKDIDRHLEQGDQVIVAYGRHLAHIELSQNPRKYRNVSEGSEITKAEVIGRRPSHMTFNFLILKEKALR